MKSSRLFYAAIMACIALSPVACKSKKKKDDSDKPADTTPAPAAAAEVEVAAPPTLIARVSLTELRQSSQVSADFASSDLASSKITDGTSAAKAYGAGKSLKFSSEASSDKGTLENALHLGNAGYDTGYGYQAGYGSGSYAGCNCGWNFPILRGIVGFVSNVGSIIFGYGYGGYSYGSYGYVNSGYATGYDPNAGYGSYDPYDPSYVPSNMPSNPGSQNFPWGRGTQYNNPSYVWTPNGPIYNNAIYNPLPTSGVMVGTIYTTGIPGCSASIYDQTRGWIARDSSANPNIPLCNGQLAPAGIGPVVGTTYSTGATSCTQSTFTQDGWVATGSPVYQGAPLCDGNVYASVTAAGGAINDQMPNFTPSFTTSGKTFAYKYAHSYDDSSYRYYVYGQ